MAYMRGPIYAYDSQTELHVWNRDGRDGMRDSGWYDALGERVKETAAGVAIPLEAANELAV